MRKKYYFGEVTFFNNYMISVMNEGVIVTREINDFLEAETSGYYRDKKFVYITHRINSYTVDPTTYANTSKIKNLAGFAVVSSIPIAISNAKIEQLFLDKPFKIFKILDEAIDWANSITNSYNDQKGT